jgi:hypothetical protein
MKNTVTSLSHENAVFAIFPLGSPFVPRDAEYGYFTANENIPYSTFSEEHSWVGTEVVKRGRL